MLNNTSNGTRIPTTHKALRSIRTRISALTTRPPKQSLSRGNC